MHEVYDAENAGRPSGAQASARLGIIGGGQLARMTALAALPLGCDVVVLERNPLSPAARLSPDSMVGDWDDRATLAQFASRVDVITLENEFVDAGALAALEAAGHRVFPSARCIAQTQDKLAQKRALRAAGLPVAEFAAVESQEELVACGRMQGWPLLLKARRNGYDGKGNYTVRGEGDCAEGWRTLGGGGRALYVEAFYPFEKELAVIITRSTRGETVVYPVVETVQRDHVCHVVRAPAQIPPACAAQAEEMARRAIETMGGVGSFGVELFLAADGDMVINELAPRVHNSGHYTIEACECSQFENHVRAVLGWPLGRARMIAPAAAMVNLLGVAKSNGRPRGLENALRVPGARVHVYEKAMSGPGRKMGHVTAVGESVEAALETARRAAGEIHFGETT